MIAPPLLCEVVRSGRVESRHHGSVALAWSDGGSWSLGEVQRPIYPRSALKPLQALALMETGADLSLGLEDRHRALLTASHSGDEQHVRGVREILQAAGIDEAALACGPHPPLDEEAAARGLAAGVAWSDVHNNCSGKHAGMLLLARRLGASLEGYLDPEHPAQRRIREVVAECCELEPGGLQHGLDGCSAPAFVMSPACLAAAFARFAAPEVWPDARADAARRLFHSVVAEPHHLAGRRQFDQALVRGTKGQVLAKRGAEGCLVLCLRREGLGVGVAIKVDDGGLRGAYPVALRILQRLGVSWSPSPEALPPEADLVVRNSAGRVTGELRAGPALDAADFPRAFGDEL